MRERLYKHLWKDKTQLKQGSKITRNINGCIMNQCATNFLLISCNPRNAKQPLVLKSNIKDQNNIRKIKKSQNNQLPVHTFIVVVSRSSRFLSLNSSSLLRLESSGTDNKLSSDRLRSFSSCLGESL